MVTVYALCWHTIKHYPKTNEKLQPSSSYIYMYITIIGKNVNRDTLTNHFTTHIVVTNGHGSAYSFFVQFVVGVVIWNLEYHSKQQTYTIHNPPLPITDYDY